MKTPLPVKEKQTMLLKELLSHPEAEGWAIFGIGKDVVKPLIEKGYLHADTYRFTGGAKLTKQGRETATLIFNKAITTA